MTSPEPRPPKAASDEAPLPQVVRAEEITAPFERAVLAQANECGHACRYGKPCPNGKTETCTGGGA